MATINLGSIKFNWKGAYSGATAYVVDDVVESSGSSYICIAATTGNAPPNASYWEQMSSAGTNGTDGTDLGTTLTTQGDIVYRDASGLQRLGAGTSGQALVTGGTGANPSWGDVSGGLVGFATAVQPTISNINSTSYTSLQLTVNYTPIDGANNKIIVLLQGGYGQDDNDGNNSHIRIRQTNGTAYTLVDDNFGVDQANGQTFNAMSVLTHDNNVTNNSALTYLVEGKADNANSDIRPQTFTTLSVMEIGV